MSLGCGSDLRISRAQVAPIVDGCAVYSWLSMTVTTPSAWTSASVSVVGPNGAALPGGNSISLTDSYTATSLSGVDFSATTDFDFLLNFDAGADLTGGITAQFTYTTDPLSRCQTSKPVLFAVPSTRSEEHTSELQSH